MKAARIAIATIGALFLFLAGSLGVAALARVSDSDRAQQTARSFCDAADRHDEAAVESLLTAKAREVTGAKAIVSSSHSDSDHQDTPTDYRIGKPIIEGEQARVPVTVSSSTGPRDLSMRLRKENGQWRVYGVSFSPDKEGSELTMNFEEPQAIVGQAFSLAGRKLGQAVGAFAHGLEQGVAAFGRGLEEGMRDASKRTADPEPVH